MLASIGPYRPRKNPICGFAATVRAARPGGYGFGVPTGPGGRVLGDELHPRSARFSPRTGMEPSGQPGSSAIAVVFSLFRLAGIVGADAAADGFGFGDGVTVWQPATQPATTSRNDAAKTPG